MSDEEGDAVRENCMGTPTQVVRLGGKVMPTVGGLTTINVSTNEIALQPLTVVKAKKGV